MPPARPFWKGYLKLSLAPTLAPPARHRLRVGAFFYDWLSEGISKPSSRKAHETFPRKSPPTPPTPTNPTVAK
jgi:hypothetical protein